MHIVLGFWGNVCRFWGNVRIRLTKCFRMRMMLPRRTRRRDTEPDGTGTRSGSERKLCFRRGALRPWESPGEVFGEDRNHVSLEGEERVGQ